MFFRNTYTIELFSTEGYQGCIGPSGKLLCLWLPTKIMLHMHGNQCDQIGRFIGLWASF